MQRIHKKKETQFETIEFKGREGKVASLLCTQNMELSIIFLFDLLFLPGKFCSYKCLPTQMLGSKIGQFFYLETLPSHPPWPGCSSPGWQRCTCWWRWGSWWPGRSGGRRWPRWCCRSFLGNPSQDQLREKIINQDVKSAKTKPNKRPSSRLTKENFWKKENVKIPSLLTDCHNWRRGNK